MALDTHTFSLSLLLSSPRLVGAFTPAAGWLWFSTGAVAVVGEG